jgi:hypothetical protein
LVGGDDAQGTDPTKPKPRDITIEKNRFHEDRENAIDIKSCHNVTIRGNKLYGYRPTTNSGGNNSLHGDALVVHRSADKILIEQNRIWNNGRAASMGSSSNCCLGSVVFRRNLVFDATTDGGGTGAGIRVSPAREVEIYHNTFYNIPNYAVGAGDDGPIQRTVMINNIIMHTGRAFSISTTNTPNLVSSRNLFWQAPLPSNWVYDTDSIFKDPLFIADPRNNDFYTLPNSPARDVAIPIGETYCWEGPDIGFLESCSGRIHLPLIQR